MTDFLPSCCDHVGQILQPSPSDKDIYSIHSSCAHLLSTMAVLCAPTDVMYKLFRKGFRHRSARSSRHSEDCEEEKHMLMSHWLNFARPHVFTEDAKRFYIIVSLCGCCKLDALLFCSLDELSTSSAVFLQLLLLIGQPHFNPPHVLQVSLHSTFLKWSLHSFSL